MKCSIRRMVTILTIVAVLTSAMAFYASAAGNSTVSSSTIYSTASCTAGTYQDESVHELNAIMPSGVYGGDVGIWFYDTSVGLQASFATVNSRYAYMECRETDTIINTLARRYFAQFGTATDGLYKPCNFGSYTATSDLLEYDGDLELYMRFIVQTAEGDTSKAVPTAILRYKFWAYSE